MVKEAYIKLLKIFSNKCATSIKRRLSKDILQ